MKFFIGFVLFSGLLVASLYSIFGTGYFYVIKDLAVVIMLLSVVILYGRRVSLGIFKYLVFVFFVGLIGIILSKSSLFLMVSSLRQFFIPFLFIAIGYFYVKSYRDFCSVTKFTILFVMLVVFFGFFERFFNIWLFIDITDFYKSKNIPFFSYGYPVFWVEPISIFGYSTFVNGIPRMVSTVFDPINLGHLLVFTFALIFFEGKRFFGKKVWYCMLILVLFGVFLTFSKGAWLQFALALIVFNNRIKFIWKILAAVPLLFFIYFYIKGHAGFLAHYLGFINIFDHVNLFGHGLGSFGNYSAMYSDNPVQGVGDSYWAAVMGQFGIIGFLFWFSTFLFMAKKIGNHYLSWLLISQVLISALSENTFNFMSVFLLMIFVGGFLRLKKSLVNNGCFVS